jgi:cytochrome c biogenesis protein CcdA
MDSLLPSISSVVASSTANATAIAGVILPFIYYGLGIVLGVWVVLFGIRKIKGAFRKVTKR